VVTESVLFAKLEGVLHIELIDKIRVSVEERKINNLNFADEIVVMEDKGGATIGSGRNMSPQV